MVLNDWRSVKDELPDLPPCTTVLVAINKTPEFEGSKRLDQKMNDLQERINLEALTLLGWEYRPHEIIVDGTPLPSLEPFTNPDGERVSWAPDLFRNDSFSKFIWPLIEKQVYVERYPESVDECWCVGSEAGGRYYGPTLEKTGIKYFIGSRRRVKESYSIYSSK